MPESKSKLDRARFKSAEYSFVIHNAVIPTEDTLEDIKRPDYWSVISNSGLIRDGDEIRMIWEDDSRLIRGFVLQCGKQWAHIRILEDHDLREKLPEVPLPQPVGYKIIWRGRHHRFGVRREADGAIIKGVNGELHSRGDAEVWLKEHLKAKAA